MTTVAEIALPADQLALGDALRAVPGTSVDVMPAVTTGSDDVMPVLAFEGGEDVGAALRADSSVTAVSPVATLEAECVYRVEWTDSAEKRLRGLFATHGTVLGTRARDGRWCFRVLFAERAEMEAWYEHCLESGLSVDVESVHDPTDAVRSREHGLSEKQYATLETALQHGFYDIPRRVTLEELAREFDVSHQALSERLSRAHRVTVTNVVSGDFPLARVE